VILKDISDLICMILDEDTRHPVDSHGYRGVALHCQQIPPSGGLSTLTASIPVNGGKVAQVPVIHHYRHGWRP